MQVHKCRNCPPAEGDVQQESNALGVKIFLLLIFLAAVFVIPHFLIDDHVLRGQVFSFTCGALFWGIIIFVAYAVITFDPEENRIHQEKVLQAYNAIHNPPSEYDKYLERKRREERSEKYEEEDDKRLEKLKRELRLRKKNREKHGRRSKLSSTRG